MNKISNEAELKSAIDQLKSLQEMQLIELKKEAIVMYESLTPFNLFKTSLQKVATIPNWRNTLVDAALGLSAGYISKKILVGNSHNPIKNVAGALMQFGVANAVVKNSEPIKHLAEKVIGWLRVKKDISKTETSD